MNKQENKIINEWLKENQNNMLFFDRETENRISLEQFQKQHNLIADELEVGKWYRNRFNENTILFIKDKTSRGYDVYGLTDNNDWINAEYPIHEYNMKEAPESYVIERLTWYAEKVMKYNHEEPNYKCLEDQSGTFDGVFKEYFIADDGDFCANFNWFYNVLMKDGEWTKTFEVEQPKEPFNHNVIEKIRHSKSDAEARRIIREAVTNPIIEQPQGYTECFLEEKVTVDEYFDFVKKLPQTQPITIKIPKGVDYKIELI